MNSKNYFLMLALSSFISGCIGGGGGGSSSAVVASTTSFLDSGTSLTYNSTNATTQATTTEFQNFNYSSASSSQNPLEVINAHKAYGYGLTGSGEIIAILDSGFSSAHLELNSSGKIIEFPDYGLFNGTIDAATGNSVTDDHGLFVGQFAIVNFQFSIFNSQLSICNFENLIEFGVYSNI